MSLTSKGRLRMRGFSMIELMVAIVLGLLVTDALVAMFVGVRSAGRTSSGVAALADSGRFALDTIEQSVRSAGNLACNSTAPVFVAGTPVVRQISLLVPGASPLVSDFGEPVEGYEGTGSAPGDDLAIANTPAGDDAAGDWATTAALGGSLDASLTAPPIPQGEAAPVGQMIKGSDVLVVRESLAGTPPSYTTNVATGAGAFTISSAAAFSAGGGQIGAITNCVQTEVFQVNTFNPGAGSGVVSLAGAPMNSGGSLSSNIDFPIGTQVVPADTIVFYVGVGADGDGALFRWESNGGLLGDGYSVNEELVPDVESMQVLYGVETALSETTQSVAQYVTANLVDSKSITGDFNGVISVKIALLVASPPGTVQQGAVAAASPPALLGTDWQLAAPDGRMRKVYEQTMFLRNMSP